MGRSNLLKLVVLFAFLVLHPGTYSQWAPRPPLAPRPLCVSQFALASHACGALPFMPNPPPSPPLPPVLDEPDINYHKQKHEEHGHKKHEEHKHNKHEEQGHNKHEENGHDKHEEQGHGHEHQRHRHHEHRHRATPLERDCCRWLAAIDSVCVCDLLVYLPAFLSKPLHKYTVVVGDTCNVTYPCASRIR
ncbi:OLC1v1007352C1 [Oldenlandia corymbosa var. corymbosa]|uniref:OLC1v1007352C1 n=1 Tax=Oldenlandia corymbosa var. corymbosa TaxID=529605 RepID=A0AAV1DLT9_OLDCO|nr:OLC1v1007352C1 [Oldenlandia corymbosa var. corymbosa]